MTNATVHFLASYYNMTIHSYRKRDYLLEVNPKYTDPSYEDYLNVIDARWIDIDTGLFIDITAVRPHYEKPDVICSKDKHEENVSSGHPSQSLHSLTLSFRFKIYFHCATVCLRDSRSRYPTITRSCLQWSTERRHLQRRNSPGRTVFPSLHCLEKALADGSPGINSMSRARNGRK